MFDQNLAIILKMKNDLYIMLSLMHLTHKMHKK